MHSIEYVRATAANIPHIFELRKLFTIELSGEQTEVAEQELDKSQTEFFTRELNKTYYNWLAFVNGEAVATAGMALRVQPGSPKNPSGRWAYLMIVYTKPEYRKRGISSQLVQHLIDKAKQLGITALELHATPEGEPVYLKKGFNLFDEPTYRMFI